MQYNPKHARSTKRSTKFRLAGVGVAGAATIMGGLATASSAQAASPWDAVAACESGGNWAINTGNGFYGGLQFTRQTWLGYGGGAYAGTANLASRDQQIAIAQKVLVGQGPGAWPVCSVKGGLTRANGGTSSAAAAPVAAPAAQASRSTVRVAPKAVAPQAVAPKAAAPNVAPPTKAAAVAPRAVAKAPAKATTMATAPRVAAKAVSGKTVTVKAGDTLSALAAKYDIKGGWAALFAANKGSVSNANLIFVGQQLQLPG
ncbi:transglycosylase family protein [Lapillicoccus sp.]|uniref:transglycosylase family protein n=1 Tax=Lapillicoccus sp. TaxID=1909287 RepID=UPI0039833066